MRIRTVLLCLLLLSPTAPADPAWWAGRGVKTTAPAANLSPATIGQAKHMAAMALAELQGHLPAPAFQALQTDLSAVVDLSLPDPLPPGYHETQRAVLLNGQLKAIAKPFYDHLRTHNATWLDNAMTSGNLVVMEPGSNPPTPSPYPWSEAATDDANRAPATLGQLKAVFSLPLETLSGTTIQDSDGDGMPDDWETQNGLNPNDPSDGVLDFDNDGLTNLQEYLAGTNPNNADSDGDGALDGDENDGNTDPTDPGSAPQEGWIILKGDSAMGERKVLNRTVTIPKGQSRIVMVALHSEEYPAYTEYQSEYNDLLEWNITPSGGTVIADQINVNDKHVDWQVAEVLGTVIKNFTPVHIEEESILTAPAEADLTVNVVLAATNTSDGALPSTVMVGFLPAVEVFNPVSQTDRSQLIVPIPELSEMTQVGQKCDIGILVPDGFTGKVIVKNNHPQDIVLAKNSIDPGTNQSDALANEYVIHITNGSHVNYPNQPDTFYVRGLKECDQASITAQLLEGTNPVPIATSDLQVIVPVVGLREIAFSGGVNAYIPLTHDDGIAFPGNNEPHWKDVDGNGDPEANHSIAYVRSSVPLIKPTIKLKNAASLLDKSKLSATGSAGGEENAVKYEETLSIANGDLATTDPKASGNWPDTIMFYGKSSPPDRPAFEMSWRISFDGGIAVDFYKSKHQVYITHAEPLYVSQNRETIFLIACDKAFERTLDMPIVSKINVYFATRQVQKMDPVTGYYIGPYLTYWGLDSTGNSYLSSTDQLLDHNNGICGTWAQFWADVVNVHGFNAVKQNIIASGISGTASASANPNAGGRKAREFILKDNVVPNPGGPYSSANYTVTPFCQGGLSATHTTAAWPSHSISKVSINGKTYYVDSSYGTGMAEGLANFCTFYAGFLSFESDYAWVPDGANADITEVP